MDKKLTMLMILDGYGMNEKEEGNAIKAANTPNMDRILKTYPVSTMYTSGREVGLPTRTNGKFRSSDI